MNIITQKTLFNLTKINNIQDLEKIKYYCNKEIKLLNEHYLEHQNLNLWGVKMDYYKRKRLAQELVKKMLKDGFKDEEITFAVEDKYQLSPGNTEKYLSRLRGGLWVFLI